MNQKPIHAYLLMDAMRTAAAFLVVISHVRDLFVLDYSGKGGFLSYIFYFMTGFGHAGVVVFFVLSGFWITKTVARRANDERFWGGYLIDRMSRIWVVAIPALLIGGILDFVGVQGLHTALYEGSSGAKSLTAPISLMPLVFFGNVFFVQTILTPVFGSNGPLWSLAQEFWFYIWFPALFLSVLRRRPSIALGSFAIAVISPVLLMGFVTWLCGAALFAWTKWGPRLNRSRGPVLLISGTIALALSLLAIRLNPVLWMDIVLALTFTWFLLGLCLVNPRTSMLSLIASYGKGTSFSLYAIHYPIAAIMAAGWINTGSRWKATPSTMALVLTLSLLIAAIAYIFSRLTEAHTGSVRHWLTQRLGIVDRGGRVTEINSVVPRNQELSD